MLQLKRMARNSCVVFSEIAVGSRRILKYDAGGFSTFDPFAVRMVRTISSQVVAPQVFMGNLTGQMIGQI